MSNLEITRLTRLEESAFYRDWYGAAPVLFPAFVRDSRACTKWSYEYLDSVIGAKSVRLHYCERSAEKTTEGVVRGTSQHIDVPFREASQRIRGTSDVAYFLMGHPIKQVLPELLGDLDFDELILRASPLLSVNLWYAAAGHLTPLHYDAYDNFLNQIAGRKRVTLFSPDEKDLLCSNGEVVNLFEPDDGKFPRHREASAMEFILEPGDTLYQPAGWFHQVESLDVTLSVNFFFGSSPKRL